MKDCFDIILNRDELGAVSSLGLAHIGDAVYELLVRGWLIKNGRTRAKALHGETVKLVRAGAQAGLLGAILPLLSDAERAVCRRARNAHTNMVPKSATLEEYHAATALEALFGWLYLSGERARLRELFELMMEGHTENAT